MVRGCFCICKAIFPGIWIRNTHNCFIIFKTVMRALNTDLFNQSIIVHPANNDAVISNIFTEKCGSVSCRYKEERTQQ